MDYIQKLTEYFRKFPGIGEKQASRFVYFLLRTNPAFAQELSEMILKIRENIHQCESCFIFFSSDQSVKKNCNYCADPTTDKKTLLVVEKDVDLDAIKQSGFSKSYFVLGGLAGNETTNKSFLRTDKLIKTIESRAKEKGGKLEEVIFAFSLSPEGEHSDFFLREIIGPMSIRYGFKISSLGRGISTGTELEYADADTIKSALKNRQ